MESYPAQPQIKDLVLAGNFRQARELLHSLAANSDRASIFNDLALLAGQLGEKTRSLELIAQASSKKDADIRVKVNRFYLSRLAELNQSRGENARSRGLETKVGNPGLNPNLSIIMRTRNRGELVRESIMSVLGQSFQDWELLIVNDGGDRAVEKTLEQLWDPRMVYVYASHSGPAGALNLGLRLARGEWLGFLDDDDLFYPDFFAKLVNWLESHPGSSVVYANAKVVYLAAKMSKPFRSELVTPGSFREDRLWSSNFISIIFTLFLRRQCLDKVPGMLEGLKSSADWEFYISLSRHFRLDYLPELAGERRYITGLDQLGKRSIIGRNLQRNLILYYHGHAPFYSFGLGRSGQSPRFLNLLQQLLNQFPDLLPALELRKLFQEPDYAFFYELGSKLEKEGKRAEAKAAYNAARRSSPGEFKAWAKWLKLGLRP